MFSIYGKGGRIFQGSLGELRRVDAPTAVARARRLVAIGLDAKDHDHEVTDRSQGLLDFVPDILHRIGVAAYADTQRIEMPRQPLTLVNSIMSTTVITIADTFTVEAAWGVLAEHGIGQAPVVDAAGVLVGLLSRGDLMQPDRLPTADSDAPAWRALWTQTVVDVMWTPVHSVAPETEIRQLARVLLDTGLPGLPVVDDLGQVVGFVSRSDILRAVVADPPLDLWT
jgi:CBS-domain-containing membrane protein